MNIYKGLGGSSRILPPEIFDDALQHMSITGEAVYDCYSANSPSDIHPDWVYAVSVEQTKANISLERTRLGWEGSAHFFVKGFFPAACTFDASLAWQEVEIGSYMIDAQSVEELRYALDVAAQLSDEIDRSIERLSEYLTPDDREIAVSEREGAEQ